MCELGTGTRNCDSASGKSVRRTLQCCSGHSRHTRVDERPQSQSDSRENREPSTDNRDTREAEGLDPLERRESRATQTARRDSERATCPSVTPIHGESNSRSIHRMHAITHNRYLMVDGRCFDVRRVFVLVNS